MMNIYDPESEYEQSSDTSWAYENLIGILYWVPIKFSYI